MGTILALGAIIIAVMLIWYVINNGRKSTKTVVAVLIIAILALTLLLVWYRYPFKKSLPDNSQFIVTHMGDRIHIDDRETCDKIIALLGSLELRRPYKQRDILSPNYYDATNGTPINFAVYGGDGDGIIVGFSDDRGNREVYDMPAYICHYDFILASTKSARYYEQEIDGRYCEILGAEAIQDELIALVEAAMTSN